MLYVADGFLLAVEKLLLPEQHLSVCRDGRELVDLWPLRLDYCGVWLLHLYFEGRGEPLEADHGGFMRRDVSFDLVCHRDDVGGVLQSWHQTWRYLPYLVLLWLLALLLGGLTQLDVLQIPQQNLPVDGSSHDDVGVFRVELERQDLQRRG